MYYDEPVLQLGGGRIRRLRWFVEDAVECLKFEDIANGVTTELRYAHRFTADRLVAWMLAADDRVWRALRAR